MDQVFWILRKGEALIILHIWLWYTVYVILTTDGLGMQGGMNTYSIVPFHKDFSPSGEQPEQHELAHTL